MEVFSWRRIFIFLVLVVKTRDFLMLHQNVRVALKSNAQSVGRL